MVKQGISPEVIVLAIQKQRGSFDTSPTGLIALKQRGVPDQILVAMLNSTPSGVLAARVRTDPRDPDIHWAFIPPSTFQMGCVPTETDCSDVEKPRHRVTLTRPFELMTTEVTVGIWSRAGRQLPQPQYGTDVRLPVVRMNWAEASAVCSAVGGRLPTEAEWEYAARGGIDDARYPWGNEAPVHTEGAQNGAAFSPLQEPGDSSIGKIDPNSRPARVGIFAPNRFGLYDMGGNLLEWVADWYGPYPDGGVTDPRGPLSGDRRILRGGWFESYPRGLRSSLRYFFPDARYGSGGVRCARDL